MRLLRYVKSFTKRHQSLSEFFWVLIYTALLEPRLERLNAYGQTRVPLQLQLFKQITAAGIISRLSLVCTQLNSWKGYFEASRR